MDADARGTVVTAVDNSRKLPLPSVPFVYPYEGGASHYERECFDEYYKLVEALLQSGEEYVTVTGTPGIGTTVFYAYFADRYLRNHSDVWVITGAHSNGKLKKVVIFKDDGSRPSSHRFKLDDVVDDATEEAMQTNKLVFFLWDGPPSSVREGGQVVVFTSPDENWLKIVEYYHCTHYMPLWTCQELHEAARVLGLRLSEDEIDRRFSIFGGVARYCLHPDETAVIRATEAIKREVSWVFDSQRLKQLLVGAETSRLLHHEPTAGSTTQYKTRLASQFVEKKLAEQVMSWNVLETEKICWWLERQDNAAALRGRINKAERRLYITH